MIPVKLTIQGLYSYQEKQTIDFSRLTSANLFGIFGAVGSGKSSILEAITFAIYGKTDRLNLSGDSRNYNMMNLKSNDLLIEFIFETGKNQTAYQVVVKGRRNGKKFEEVKTLERSAYRNEGGNWIPIEPEQLEKVIGLSYDNFKRTIIIPQGQFQEFLQLGNKDRSQMMMDLFELKKYELLNKVTSLESKNNAEKQMLDGQLKQLGELDPDQAKVFSEQLTQLKVEIDKLNGQILANQKMESELKNLLELVRKKEESNRKLTALNAKLPEITDLEKRIADFEYCWIHFKNLFEAADEAAKKILQLNEKIRIEIRDLKISEEQILEAEQVFGKVKLDFESRDKLIQQAEELDKIIRQGELTKLIVEADDRIKKGNVFVAESLETIGKLKLEKQDAEGRLKSEKEKQPDLVALSNAKSWHDLNKNLLQQFASNAAENMKYTREILDSDHLVQNYFANELFFDFSGERKFEAGRIFLKEKADRLKDQIAGLDVEIQHLKVQQKLEEYAISLKEGEACPICGSKHHPEILSAANVSEGLKKLSVQKSAAEKTVGVCDMMLTQLNDLENNRKLTDRQLAGIQTKKAELEAQNVAHLARFQWEDFRKEEDVIRAFQLADQLKKHIQELEKQIETTDVKLDREKAKKEKFVLEIDKITKELTASETELSTLKGLIKILDIKLYSGKTKENLTLEKSGLLKKYAEIEHQYSNLNRQLVELRKTRDTVSGSLNANQNQLAQEEKSAEVFQLKIEKTLRDSAFETIGSVKLILQQELNLASEKQKVSSFRNDVSVTQNQLALLDLEIGDQKYDEEIHQKLRQQLDTDKEMVNRKNQESGMTEKSLADLQKSLEEQKILGQTLEKLQLRAENIKTMKTLFTASGFVNYISSVYLQNLCQAANDRFFQLTRQKLSLEITGDNNFQVRDYLNGGKVRSVKTLSGGQTFQAALSLALALADNIQKITESNQNFFFLDEGFGSLDKESLSIVFDALKSLRKENRIVGVISHVEEMQQEIDVHLRIVNEDETGSIILPSWE